MSNGEEQIIFENLFNTYFSDIVNYHSVISWDEPGLARITMPRNPVLRKIPPLIWKSRDVMLTGLGTANPGWTIPGTLLQATYLFKFRILPEDRLMENLSVQFMWYGGGHNWGEGWGLVSWPLFRIVLNAATNRLSLIFDGYRQVEWGSGGKRNIYPFESWTYDLGPVANFKDWTWFALWMDLGTKTFKRMWFGKEVKWPAGYEEGIQPTQYTNYMYNGMLSGLWMTSSIPNSTNITFEIDDVSVWTGFHTPPSNGNGPSTPGGMLIPVILIGGILLFAVIALGDEEKKNKKRRR